MISARGVDALVVGAGVAGLTTAVCLAEAGLRVRIHTATPPGRTTSAVAGALWMPYLVEPYDRVRAWSSRTLDELRSLADDPATTGVRLARGMVAGRDGTGAEPPWARTVGAVPGPAAALPAGYTAGWEFTAPLVEMPRYLAYLADRFRAAGGGIEERPVGHLDEVVATPAAPVVVNCAGVGARALVPDPWVRPVRGQVVVVRNPGVEEFFAEEPGPSPRLCYLLPHRDTLLLGGTAEPDEWDLAPSPDTAAEIIARCARIVPEVATAPVLAHRVGLRPVRDAVRLEEEVRGGVRIVHNYGHGGGGVTLSWGCAREVVSRITTPRPPEAPRPPG